MANRDSTRVLDPIAVVVVPLLRVLENFETKLKNKTKFLSLIEQKSYILMAELINNSKTYEFVFSWGRLMCLEIGVYLTPGFLRIWMFSLVVLDVTITTIPLLFNNFIGVGIFLGNWILPDTRFLENPDVFPGGA
jgi:hypothetical protein